MVSIRPIRRATQADLGAISALCDEMDAEHAAGVPSIFRATERSWRPPEFWQTALLAEHSTLFVVESEQSEVVGYALLVIHTSADLPHAVPRRLGVVEDLVVGAAHRRAGLGTRLLEHACKAARELGATSVEIWVWDFNRGALALYEQTGFVGLRRRLIKPL